MSTSATAFTPDEYAIISLLYDPLVQKSTIGPNRVFCLACGSRVAFRLQTYYATAGWDHHKAYCQKAQAAQRSVDNNLPFVVADRMEGLTPEDVAVDNNEKIHGRGMYSRKMMDEIKRLCASGSLFSNLYLPPPSGSVGG
ncbi:hypothetical protein L218DRAFT_1004296 [Marasmius fiardii PR-910]|nr:hypothetical protein L218DRAFT_1004296 [Marasmius fiardii PR-910]